MDTGMHASTVQCDMAVHHRDGTNAHEHASHGRGSNEHQASDTGHCADIDDKTDCYAPQSEYLQVETSITVLRRLSTRPMLFLVLPHERNSLMHQHPLQRMAAFVA